MSEGIANSLTLNAHSYLAGERVVCRLSIVRPIMPSGAHGPTIM
jgi:hypothetical protein